MLAWVSPAVATGLVGAPGTTALTVKLRLICGAGRKEESPAWSALMVQVPAVTKVSAPPVVMVQTPGVELVKDTVYPPPADEDAVSVGAVPKFCAPGLAKGMVWGEAGVTELEAADAGPVPALLVAVTVNVYATPFASPVTVIGEPEPVPVAPNGFEVTV